MARTTSSVITRPVVAPVAMTYQSPLRPDTTRFPWLSRLSAMEERVARETM